MVKRSPPAFACCMPRRNLQHQVPPSGGMVLFSSGSSSAASRSSSMESPEIQAFGDASVPHREVQQTTQACSTWVEGAVARSSGSLLTARTHLPEAAAAEPAAVACSVAPASSPCMPQPPDAFPGVPASSLLQALSAACSPHMLPQTGGMLAVAQPTISKLRQQRSLHRLHGNHTAWPSSAGGAAPSTDCTSPNNTIHTQLSTPQSAGGAVPPTGNMPTTEAHACPARLGLPSPPPAARCMRHCSSAMSRRSVDSCASGLSPTLSARGPQTSCRTDGGDGSTNRHVRWYQGYQTSTAPTPRTSNPGDAPSSNPVYDLPSWSAFRGYLSEEEDDDDNAAEAPQYRHGFPGRANPLYGSLAPVGSRSVRYMRRWSSSLRVCPNELWEADGGAAGEEVQGMLLAMRRARRRHPRRARRTTNSSIRSRFSARSSIRSRASCASSDAGSCCLPQWLMQHEDMQLLQAQLHAQAMTGQQQRQSDSCSEGAQQDVLTTVTVTHSEVCHVRHVTWQLSDTEVLSPKANTDACNTSEAAASSGIVAVCQISPDCQAALPIPAADVLQKPVTKKSVPHSLFVVGPDAPEPAAIEQVSVDPVLNEPASVEQAMQARVAILVLEGNSDAVADATSPAVESLYNNKVDTYEDIAQHFRLGRPALASCVEANRPLETASYVECDDDPAGNSAEQALPRPFEMLPPAIAAALEAAAGPEAAAGCHSSNTTKRPAPRSISPGPTERPTKHRPRVLPESARLAAQLAAEAHARMAAKAAAHTATLDAVSAHHTDESAVSSMAPSPDASFHEQVGHHSSHAASFNVKLTPSRAALTQQGSRSQRKERRGGAARGAHGRTQATTAGMQPCNSLGAHQTQTSAARSGKEPLHAFGPSSSSNISHSSSAGRAQRSTVPVLVLDPSVLQAEHWQQAQDCTDPEHPSGNNDTAAAAATAAVTTPVMTILEPSAVLLAATDAITAADSVSRMAAASIPPVTSTAAERGEDSSCGNAGLPSEIPLSHLRTACSLANQLAALDAMETDSIPSTHRPTPAFTDVVLQGTSTNTIAARCPQCDIHTAVEETEGCEAQSDGQMSEQADDASISRAGETTQPDQHASVAEMPASPSSEALLLHATEPQQLAVAAPEQQLAQPEGDSQPQQLIGALAEQLSEQLLQHESAADAAAEPEHEPAAAVQQYSTAGPTASAGCEAAINTDDASLFSVEAYAALWRAAATAALGPAAGVVVELESDASAVHTGRKYDGRGDAADAVHGTALQQHDHEHAVLLQQWSTLVSVPFLHTQARAAAVGFNTDTLMAAAQDTVVQGTGGADTARGGAVGAEGTVKGEHTLEHNMVSTVSTSAAEDTAGDMPVEQVTARTTMMEQGTVDESMMEDNTVEGEAVELVKVEQGTLGNTTVEQDPDAAGEDTAEQDTDTAADDMMGQAAGHKIVGEGVVQEGSVSVEQACPQGGPQAGATGCEATEQAACQFEETQQEEPAASRQEQQQHVSSAEHALEAAEAHEGPEENQQQQQAEPTPSATHLPESDDSQVCCNSADLTNAVPGVVEDALDGTCPADAGYVNTAADSSVTMPSPEADDACTVGAEADHDVGVDSSHLAITHVSDQLSSPAPVSTVAPLQGYRQALLSAASPAHLRAPTSPASPRTPTYTPRLVHPDQQGQLKIEMEADISSVAMPVPMTCTQPTQASRSASSTPISGGCSPDRRQGGKKKQAKALWGHHGSSPSQSPVHESKISNSQSGLVTPSKADKLLNSVADTDTQSDLMSPMVVRAASDAVLAPDTPDPGPGVPAAHLQTPTDSPTTAHKVGAAECSMQPARRSAVSKALHKELFAASSATPTSPSRSVAAAGAAAVVTTSGPAAGACAVVGADGGKAVNTAAAPASNSGSVTQKASGRHSKKRQAATGVQPAASSAAPPAPTLLTNDGALLEDGKQPWQSMHLQLLVLLLVLCGISAVAVSTGLLAGWAVGRPPVSHAVTSPSNNNQHMHSALRVGFKTGAAESAAYPSTSNPPIQQDATLIHSQEWQWGSSSTGSGSRSCLLTEAPQSWPPAMQIGSPIATAPEPGQQGAHPQQQQEQHLQQGPHMADAASDIGMGKGPALSDILSPQTHMEMFAAEQAVAKGSMPSGQALHTEHSAVSDCEQFTQDSAQAVLPYRPPATVWEATTEQPPRSTSSMDLSGTVVQGSTTELSSTEELHSTGDKSNEVAQGSTTELTTTTPTLDVEGSIPPASTCPPQTLSATGPVTGTSPVQPWWQRLEHLHDTQQLAERTQAAASIGPHEPGLADTSAGVLPYITSMTVLLALAYGAAALLPRRLAAHVVASLLSDWVEEGQHSWVVCMARRLHQGARRWIGGHEASNVAGAPDDIIHAGAFYEEDDMQGPAAHDGMLLNHIGQGAGLHWQPGLAAAAAAARRYVGANVRAAYWLRPNRMVPEHSSDVVLSPRMARAGVADAEGVHHLWLRNRLVEVWGTPLQDRSPEVRRLMQ